MQNIFIHSWKNKLAGTLAAILLLIYLRPYYGIRHDSILYLGQSLLRLDPANFQNDLFFAFGSQADFTLLPTLIAWILQRTDAAHTFLWLTVIGLFFFLGASIFLLHRLFPPKFAYWGLLALLIFPPNYGGFGVFSYAESFFTARSLAEPLALVALASYVSGAYVWTVLWIVLAAMMHPLQIAPVITVVWCDLVRRDRRWLHALWLPSLLLAGGFFGVPHSEKWMLRFDPEWFEWISEPTRHVFITQWDWVNWSQLALDVFLVLLLQKQAEVRLQLLAKALLAATVLSLTASVVLADLWHNVLATGLQLWRVQWLLHWLAVAASPFLLLRQYQLGGRGDMRLWLLGAAIALGMPSPAMSAAAVWPLVLLYHFWPKLAPRVSDRFKRLLFGALLVALVIVLFKGGLNLSIRYSQNSDTREILRPEYLILSFPIITALLMVFGIYFYSQQPRWRNIVCIGLLLALVHAATEWDRRNTMTRYIEAAQADTPTFGVALETGAAVLWSDELLAPWLTLHRPSYYNGHQNAGILFNRDTAKEAMHRKKTLSIFMFQMEICNMLNGSSVVEATCTLDASEIARTCQAAGKDLSYIVLNDRIPKKYAGTWSIISNHSKSSPIITYHLYRCKDFAAAER